MEIHWPHSYVSWIRHLMAGIWFMYLCLLPQTIVTNISTWYSFLHDVDKEFNMICGYILDSFSLKFQSIIPYLVLLIVINQFSLLFRKYKVEVGSCGFWKSREWLEILHIKNCALVKHLLFQRPGRLKPSLDSLVCCSLRSYYSGSAKPFSLFYMMPFYTSIFLKKGSFPFLQSPKGERDSPCQGRQACYDLALVSVLCLTGYFSWVVGSGSYRVSETFAAFKYFTAFVLC